MPVYIPYEFVTHVRKVKHLYKMAVRDLEARFDEKHVQRIEIVMMRQEFEKNRNIRDPIEARKVLEHGYETIKKRVDTYIQRKFPSSPGGVAFLRGGFPVQDFIVDYYHPLEKAQYPKYFATREKRKKEFIEWYDRTYGRPEKLEVQEGAHEEQNH